MACWRRHRTSSGMPMILNVPGVPHRRADHLAACFGRARKRPCQQHHGRASSLLVLALFVIVGAQHIDTANYIPFAPNGFRGIHQGAAIVFFAYIGFDAVSTAAEETKNPQRNLPIGILGGLAICTLIYMIVGAVATGIVPYQQLASADPLARALRTRRAAQDQLDRGSWCGRLTLGGAAGVPVRSATHLLRDGEGRTDAAVGRQGPSEDARPPRHDDHHRSVCRAGCTRSPKRT